jgi:hypothetical protein
VLSPFEDAVVILILNFNFLKFSNMKNKQSDSYNYNHSLEKEYMSNISEAFLKAEEETKRAEKMLAKWRKDNNTS